VATLCDPGTYAALKKAVGGADLHFINFGIDEAPIVLAARVLVARAYSALAFADFWSCMEVRQRKRGLP
jgi:hypothetical protein